MQPAHSLQASALVLRAHAALVQESSQLLEGIKQQGLRIYALELSAFSPLPPSVAAVEVWPLPCAKSSSSSSSSGGSVCHL